MHVFITWGNNRLCSFTNQGELYTDSLRGLPKLGRWLCFGFTPGLSTSSSTLYEHHISHSHPYSLRMASRLRIRRLSISTFPLAPMNHPHHQPYRSSSFGLRSCLPRQYSTVVPNHQNFHTFPGCFSHFTAFLSTMVVFEEVQGYQDQATDNFAIWLVPCL